MQNKKRVSDRVNKEPGSTVNTGIAECFPNQSNRKTDNSWSEIESKMIWKNTYDGIVLYNNEGIILKVNAAFCKMVQKTKAQLHGKFIGVISAKTIDKEAKAEYHKNSLKNNSAPYEEEISLWNGNQIWIERTDFFSKTNNKKIVFGSIIRDITEKKCEEAILKNIKLQLEEEVKIRISELSKANAELTERIIQYKKLEESLQYSKKFLHRIINTVSNPIFVKDEKHSYILVNEAFCDILEKNKYELIDETEFDVFPEDTAGIVYEKDQKLLKRELNEIQYQFEMPVNGKKKTLSVTKKFFQDENNEKFIVCSAVDITKIIRAEEEILKSLSKERELNELKSKFVSMVSHEYRTPLTSILSSVELLELFESDLSIEEKKNYYNKIYGSINYLTNMLNDLLTLNRAEAGKATFNPEDIEIVGFCKKLAAEEMINCRNTVKIIVTANKDFAYLNLDSKLLNMILGNLLSNSVKYSFGCSEVLFNLEITDKSVLFVIKDYGRGIPFEEHDKLFDAFFRAKNVLNIPGSGLGLTIVKRFVDLHKGEISFTSQEGKGTEFRVLLPG